MTIPTHNNGSGSNFFSLRVINKASEILNRIEVGKGWKRIETARKLQKAGKAGRFHLTKGFTGAILLTIEGIRAKLNRVDSSTSCSLDCFLSIVGFAQGWDEEDALDLLDVISKFDRDDIKKFLHCYAEPAPEKGKVAIDPLSHQKTMDQK